MLSASALSAPAKEQRMRTKASAVQGTPACQLIGVYARSPVPAEDRNVSSWHLSVVQSMVHLGKAVASSTREEDGEQERMDEPSSEWHIHTMDTKRKMEDVSSKPFDPGHMQHIQRTSRITIASI